MTVLLFVACCLAGYGISRPVVATTRALIPSLGL